MVLFPATELLQPDECPKKKKHELCSWASDSLEKKNEEYIIELKKKMTEIQVKFWE